MSDGGLQPHAEPEAADVGPSGQPFVSFKDWVLYQKCYPDTKASVISLASLSEAQKLITCNMYPDVQGLCCFVKFRHKTSLMFGQA